jgi:hypothetical protein
MTFRDVNLNRRLILRYTDATKIVYSVAGDGFDYCVEVIGDPDNGSYEWLIRCGDEAMKHSDCGYGMASIALRDGLIEHFGLSESHLASAQKLAKVIERQSFVLMELMQAYERRIRSDCKTQDELDKRPWECAEYRAAADLLKTLHSSVPAADSGEKS